MHEFSIGIRVTTFALDTTEFEYDSEVSNIAILCTSTAFKSVLGILRVCNTHSSSENISFWI